MPLVSGFGTRLTAKAGTTVSGTDVTGWLDQVTGTRDHTVPSGETAPQISEQLNGVDVLTFNGDVLQINDGLNSRESSTDGNAIISYLLIKSPLSGFGYVLDAASAQDRQGVLVHGSPSRYGGRVASSAFYGEATANEWAALTVVHTPIESSSNSKIYLNGTIIGEEAGFGTISGTGLTIGASGSLLQNGNFTVAEIVEYYDVTEHTQSEVEQNVSYFQDEWGLSLLPNYVSGPITKDGVPQAGVVVQVTAYDDYTMATGKEVVGDYTTDANGVINIPNADVPTGKRLFLAPHYNDAGTLSSAQGKFVSDTF